MPTHLKIVTSAKSKRGDPKPRRCMKATFWFTAAEWLMLMRLATGVEPGKVSLGAWFRKVHGLDDAEATFDRRSTSAVIRKMHKPPQAVAARTARSHRRAAA